VFLLQDGRTFVFVTSLVLVMFPLSFVFQLTDPMLLRPLLSFSWMQTAHTGLCSANNGQQCEPSTPLQRAGPRRELLSLDRVAKEPPTCGSNSLTQLLVASDDAVRAEFDLRLPSVWLCRRRRRDDDPAVSPRLAARSTVRETPESNHRRLI